MRETEHPALQLPPDIHEQREDGERRSENIVESISEITPEVRANIGRIRNNLLDMEAAVRRYEQAVSGNEGADDEQKRACANRLANAIPIERLLSDFRYHEMDQHIPSVRQLPQGFDSEAFFAKYPRGYRRQEFLPETVEAAFLANDSTFTAALDTIASTLRMRGIGSDKWRHFMAHFDTIPRQDEERIRRYLAKPVTRVARSIFTHVTSEIALEDLLKSGSLQSASFVPEASRKKTGAYPGTSNLASQRERSIIFFDQNSVSASYGRADGILQEPRKLWFVARGDLLLKHGLLNREPYDGAHPFMPGRNLSGAMFHSPERPSDDKQIDNSGAAIPLDNLLIVIPEGANDIREKILSTHPEATVVSDLGNSHENSEMKQTMHRTVEIDTIQRLNHYIQEKFGSAHIPELALTAVDAVNERTPSGIFQSPVMARMLTRKVTT